MESRNWELDKWKKKIPTHAVQEWGRRRKNKLAVLRERRCYDKPFKQDILVPTEIDLGGRL